MEITPKQIDDLNIHLTVKLGKEDYQDVYEQALKKYRKQVNMPGFRKGNVPMSLVQRQYGKSILAEEVNRILNDGLYNHIQSNKLSILGNPLPIETDTPEGDWDNPDTFEFQYEIGLAPDIDLDKVTQNPPVRFVVKADDKMLDEHVDDLSRRHGKLEVREISEEQDLVIAKLSQLDADGNILEGGIESETTFPIDIIEDADFKKKLIGLKVGDEFSADPMSFSEDHDTVANRLGITHEQFHHIKGEFRVHVKEVKRMIPHEVNQSLFDKVFGLNEVTDIDSFRAKLAEQLEKMFERDSEFLFKRQFSEGILDNLDTPLPDAFLKRWIQMTNDKPITEEQIEQEYSGYSRHLRWQLIEGIVMRENEIRITEDDIQQQAKGMIGAQYAQYGIPLEGEILDNLAKNSLADRKERQRVIDILQENRVIEALTSKVNPAEQQISYDEFLTIARENKM